MKKYRIFLVFVIIVAGTFYVSSKLSPILFGDEQPSIYGETEISAYLTGQFAPASHPLFIALDKAAIPTDGRKHYLRTETADALKKMFEDFSKEHPQIKIYVRSSTRNYNDQANIWNNKWKLHNSIKDERQRALKILQYSSMPGTSRHHWGTDFDINELNNEYYLKGNGKIIYSWLKENAAKYGFYQPYTADRKAGYNEEKWHWSYKPLSAQFVKDWNENFSGDSAINLLSVMKSRGGFHGIAISWDMAELYVNSINPDCL